MNVRFTSHSLEEMQRRGIPRDLAEQVCAQPEQTIPQSSGRVVLQSRIEFEPGKTYLVRVFVDPNDQPPAVVTVYRTSKIQKYWRTT